jgi:hypothetical protein
MVACNDYIILDTMIYRVLQVRGEKEKGTRARARDVHLSLPLTPSISIFSPLSPQMHFRSHPAYADLVDLFHETTYQTAHGQMLDVKTAPIGTVREKRREGREWGSERERKRGRPPQPFFISVLPPSFTTHRSTSTSTRWTRTTASSRTR